MQSSEDAPQGRTGDLHYLTSLKKLVGQLRKLGATRVAIQRDFLDVEFRDTKCEKEHYAPEDEMPSEEEWQRRHKWYNEFGERSIEEAKKYLDSGDYAEDNKPYTPFSPDTLKVAQPEGEPEEDKFGKWFADDPNPPHFNR